MERQAPIRQGDRDEQEDHQVIEADSDIEAVEDRDSSNEQQHKNFQHGQHLNKQSTSVGAKKKEREAISRLSPLPGWRIS